MTTRGLLVAFMLAAVCPAGFLWGLAGVAAVGLFLALAVAAT